LFDYDNSAKTGKPNGIDIKEQKMTLPLIYLLNNSSWGDKRKIINVVKNHNTNPEKVANVIEIVNKSGGIEYAREKMKTYHSEALQILSEFPDSPSKTAMQQLVNFTIERKK